VKTLPIRSTGWGGEQTVQYEGLASEPRGAEFSRFQQAFFAVWPHGPSRLTWPGIAYFAVKPRWVRYSDFDQSPPQIVELRFPQPGFRAKMASMKTATVAIIFLTMTLPSGCRTRIDKDWEAAKNANTAADYTAFLSQHPTGPHSEDAREALDAIPVPYRDSYAVSKDGEHTDQFQSVGEIQTANGCSVLDTKRSDGQPGLFVLSSPIENPRGMGFDTTGAGTLQKVGTGVGMDENVGVLYVIGKIERVSQGEIVIAWNGCGKSWQHLLTHTTPTSTICQGNTRVTIDKLDTGRRITAEVKTSGTPADTLVKAVMGSRTIRLRPMFQLHFAMLGGDFWDGKENSCAE